MSRRLALLIGNVRYQDGRLHTPVSGKSFTALADALEAPAAGRFDDLFVLVNKPAVEVQLAFAEFLEESHEPDDLLLLYFAGHALHYNGRTFLAAWDTFSEQYLDATTIEADYIKRRFAMSQARHKLIVLDCTTGPLLPNTPVVGKPAPDKPVADSRPVDENPADKSPADNSPADESVANEDAVEESAANKDAANDSPTEDSATEKREVADQSAAKSQAEEMAWLAQAFEGSGAVVMVAARPFGTADGAASTFTPALTDALRSGAADRDNNQFITAGEWFDYAQKATAASGQQCRLVGDNAVRLVVAPVPAFKGVVPIICEPLPVVDDEELVTAVSATDRPNRRILLAALLVLLLLLLAGGLYSSGYWEQMTAGLSDNGSSGDGASDDGSTPVDAATPTTAVVAVLPTAEPTNTVPATKTAVPQTAVPTPTPTPSPTPTRPASKATVTPASSPSPSPTPLPVGVQIVRQLVFMRSGPAINFRIVDYLAQGTAVTVLARTESSDWYNIQLEDGRTGWVYIEMVDPPADGAPDDIPIAATLPAPADEFYDFVARPTADGLTISVGHVYAGTAGEEASFTAELLPETSLIQPIYENGQALGLGEFVVRFGRVGEGEYASTAVRLCMVSTAGEPFFCQTFPITKEW